MGKYDIKIDEINEKAVNETEKYILECEAKYHKQIDDIARNIKKQKDKVKFVLLAGPSSAGKTTTSKLLCQSLNAVGFDAKSLSLDDFFVDRDETPLWEDGSKNFESVDAIDWTLFDKCVNELLNQKKSKLPTYDFKSGKKFFSTGETEFRDGTIMVIEGLHALNPVIDNFIPKEFSKKIYLSVRADIIENDKKLLDGNAIRFVRRLIRDLYTRGASIENTYEMWKYVRKGEELYIQPFKDTAQFYINSFHGYELCVYKTILDHLKANGINPESVNETVKGFKSIDKNLVPDTSLLQEFVH